MGSALQRPPSSSDASRGGPCIAETPRSTCDALAEAKRRLAERGRRQSDCPSSLGRTRAQSAALRGVE
ncbi:hypothetical protein EMIHUDRAFT_353401 [Emiliania huxleyi CCMP1516]|uniref:Uncharacterized protein n=2 Tax=Emiliania huxleyi TaxID=2903 RepID=A0A0D3JXY7_EMIH1|nr:hypothetical protein EMIHUDRAFT_353401 [Emiliania huxleyi CCMP1516]EOD28372.1 hypothetical protein EMIHUDRAFT_353401 [Emiliania huxleyi CCMP1516]|eukprot:XP_005780801.1 hypothetical protein EMIHUDRAFT_353401 [Emiliania huxleyi CCMP1516]